MDLERTPVAQAEFDRIAGAVWEGPLPEPGEPCGKEAGDFEGKCYLAAEHDGEHAFQPVLFSEFDDEPLECGIENPESCESCQ